MKIARRIFLFVTVNILIISTLTFVMHLLGVQPYLNSKGIQYESLIIFCLIWGFGGAFISLALSRVMARWMMGVKIIDPDKAPPEMQYLVSRVQALARNAGLEKTPQIGYYESEELNAFATGPTKNRSLVAVSTGLLQKMNQNELDGVLAHEVAHIANGDMVTMTLVQGVINAFVMFLARVIGFFTSQLVDEEKRHWVQFVTVMALEILFGILGMIVVSAFSRYREYKADLSGAQLTGKNNLIAALERLKLNSQINTETDQPALASFKISGKSNRFFKLFSTHPDLNDRIERLKNFNSQSVSF